MKIGIKYLVATLIAAMIQVVQAGTSTTTYIYTDPQGTPLAEADASGAITATYDYRPYGAQALGNPPNGPGYTGHVNDPDTGLVYMQARYYDPVAERFISVDPVMLGAGDPFNFSRYDYARNNPIINIDPDGRDSVGENIDENAQAAADSGNKLATFGWAFIGVAWSVLGNESVSQVADKGNAASKTDMVMAAISIVSLGKGEKAATVAKDAVQGIEDVAKAAPSFDSARRAAFEKAGMIDPSKVHFSKVDPKTGTVVEFKGPGGAKIGYDGPHASPGPHHDTQHISWQTAGKRDSGGAQRGNEPYSGPQHPSRPDRKEQ